MEANLKKSFEKISWGAPGKKYWGIYGQISGAIHIIYSIIWKISGRIPEGIYKKNLWNILKRVLWYFLKKKMRQRNSVEIKGGISKWILRGISNGIFALLKHVRVSERIEGEIYEKKKKKILREISKSVSEILKKLLEELLKKSIQGLLTEFFLKLRNS